MPNVPFNLLDMGIRVFSLFLSLLCCVTTVAPLWLLLIERFEPFALLCKDLTEGLLLGLGKFCSSITRGLLRPQPIINLSDSLSSSPSSSSSGFSSSSSDYSGEVDEINAKFAEAREEIDVAMDSKETVYFNEEAQSAREAVMLVLDKYNGLLDRLPEAERGTLQRSMGLKMEQLKAELDQLNS